MTIRPIKLTTRDILYNRFLKNFSWLIPVGFSQRSFRVELLQQLLTWPCKAIPEELPVRQGFDTIHNDPSAYCRSEKRYGMVPVCSWWGLREDWHPERQRLHVYFSHTEPRSLTLTTWFERSRKRKTRVEGHRQILWEINSELRPVN